MCATHLRCRRRSELSIFAYHRPKCPKRMDGSSARFRVGAADPEAPQPPPAPAIFGHAHLPWTGRGLLAGEVTLASPGSPGWADLPGHAALRSPSWIDASTATNRPGGLQLEHEVVDCLA